VIVLVMAEVPAVGTIPCK